MLQIMGQAMLQILVLHISIHVKDSVYPPPHASESPRTQNSNSR